MMRYSAQLTILFAALAVILSTGCGSTEPSRFYMLTPMEGSWEYLEGDNSGALSLEVGPVNTAAYLQNPGIATRTTRNEIKYAVYDRWAEPLKNGAASILAKNLSNLLKTTKVDLYPWRARSPVDIQVVVDLIRFDCEENGNGEGARVILNARWVLIDGKSREILLFRWSNLRGDVGEDASYNEIAAAMSDILEELSRKIAAGIEAAKPSGAE